MTRPLPPFTEQHEELRAEIRRFVAEELRPHGFRLHWPSWVMSSVPLPGLDRYLPTRPARLL